MDLNDFQCKCGNCPKILPDEHLSAIIEAVENHFRREIVITSGMRCQAHNATISGASSGSFHTMRKALDCHMPGVELQELYDWVDRESPYPCGLGIYRSHVHIDARGYPGRWDSR